MQNDKLDRYIQDPITRDCEEEKKGNVTGEVKKKQAENEQVPLALEDTLKPLPSHLKYVFLESKAKPVIISSLLTELEEELLIELLRNNKDAIGWKISDFKGINPSICSHQILMEDDVRPTIQPQR